MNNPYLGMGLEITENICKATVNKYPKLRPEYADLLDYTTDKLIGVLERLVNDTNYANPKAFIGKSIRGHCYNYIRDKSGLVRIPRRYTKIYMDAAKLRNKLSSTDEDLMAANLGIDVNIYRKAIDAVRTRHVSLDSVSNLQSVEYDYEEGSYEALDFIKKMNIEDRIIMEDYWLDYKKDKKISKNDLERIHGIPFKDIEKKCESFKVFLNELIG